MKTKTTLILLMILLLLSSCKIKTKAVEKTKEESKIEIQSETKETKIDSTKTIKKEEKTKTTENKESEENQFVDINATVEFDKPFTFTTFKNGVPEKMVTVSGNASVQIKTITSEKANKSKESENRVQENKQLTALDYFRKSDSLAKSKIETKDSETKISKSGFQAGIYIWLGLLIVIALVLYLIYKYFKR